MKSIIRKIIIYIISAVLLFSVGYFGYGIAVQYVLPKNKEVKHIAKSNKKKEKVEQKKKILEPKEEESDEWKDAYVAWIREQKEGCTFRLVNLNDDNIPEIICLGDCNATGTTFATYSDGQVQEENVWGMGVSYIEGKNLLDDNSGNCGEFYDGIYTIQKGQWVQIAKGEYKVKDPENPDVDDMEYTWDNKKVSEEAYSKELKKIYDKDQAVSTEGDENFVSADEIINKIGTSTSGAD